MKIHYFLLIFAGVLMSCGNNSKLSITQDFEQIGGWYQAPTLIKGKAHSGQYFCRTGAGQEYSQTYISRLGDITEDPIRRIDMGAWFRLADAGAKARLVMSIHSGDSTLFWQGLDTQDVSPQAGEWTRLFFTYDLPEGIRPEHTIKFFLWNTSGREVDVDDFDIHFYTK